MTNLNLIDFVDASALASEAVRERTLTLTGKGGSGAFVYTDNGMQELDAIEDKRLRLIRKMLFELTALGIRFEDPELNEELNKYQP